MFNQPARMRVDRAHCLMFLLLPYKAFERDTLKRAPQFER
jgi:hypothetical protein